MTNIHFIDSLAGSGKTYSLARHAHKLARHNQKIIFVQPSKLLIEKTVSEELKRLGAVRSRVIDGDETGSVIRDIVNHLKSTTPGGEILFITHAAFLRVPHFENRQNWIVIVDEVFQVDQYEALNLPRTHHLLTDHIDAVPESLAYSAIQPKDDQARQRLNGIGRNKSKDEVHAVISGFARRVVSPHWRVFILAEQYRDLLAGRKRQLCSFSVLQPSIFDGFRRVIMAGACFQETMLYRLWSTAGVTFTPLKLPLRYEAHSNGLLLTINYLIEGRWSKALRDKQAPDGAPIGAKVKAEVLLAFGVTPFLWMANKDIPDDYFGTPGQVNAQRLPNSPHGLNGFQAFHAIVVLAALNPAPAHFTFLASQGIEDEEVRTALYRSAVYQAVMRSSLRNPDDVNAKQVIVMDRETAEWLAALFPGANVAPLGGVPMEIMRDKSGRPRKHQCDADRKAASARKKEAELLVEQGLINDGELAEEFGAGTFYDTIYSVSPHGHADYRGPDDFIAWLHEFHSTAITRKEDATLISPAHFDPDASSKTSRGLENVAAVRGIWLDNDGGVLTHQVFAKLFPRLRMAIWNTFSSTPEQPRWRVFIPTSQAMSVRAHRLIVDEIIARLNHHGYWSPKQLSDQSNRKNKGEHGFDLSKLNAASLFYLPSQARHPDGSFFVDYADEKRRPLEPCAWIKKACSRSPEPAPAMQPVANGALSIGGVETAIQRWHDDAPYAGRGHDAFFRLGGDLRRAGQDDHVLRHTLFEEASYARNPEERRAEIDRIVARASVAAPLRRAA